MSLALQQPLHRLRQRLARALHRPRLLADRRRPDPSAILGRETSSAAVAAASIGVVPGGGGQGGATAAATGGGVTGPLISSATSVHELLECPVFTNSMYPPIHQSLYIVGTGFIIL